MAIEKKLDLVDISLETTRRCNLKCTYCMARPQTKPSRGELTTEEIKHRVIDELAQITERAVIYFTGGEFLLREDRLEILEYNRSKGFTANVLTNGILVNEKTIEEIRKVTSGKFFFTFSINSIDEELNRASRNDSLSTFQRCMQLCEEMGVGFYALTTVSKGNLSSLGRTMNYLRMMQIPVLRDPFVPRGAGKHHKDLRISKEDMEQIVHPTLRENPLAYASYTPFFIPPEYMEKKAREFEGFGILNFGCYCGSRFAGISAEGDVAPCPLLVDSVKYGNVGEDSLAEILLSHPVFLALERSEVKGKCGICRYKKVCKGCRALAYYKSGDVLAEDPICFFEPEDETSVSELEKITQGNLERFLDYAQYTSKIWDKIFD